MFNDIYTQMEQISKAIEQAIQNGEDGYAEELSLQLSQIEMQEAKELKFQIGGQLQ